MKALITNKKNAIMLIVFCVVTNLTLAQWNPQTAGAFTWYRITPAAGIQGVGIGNFASPNNPLAALHVNTNLLPAIGGNPANLGEVFRTDCPAGNNTFWRMFRGGIDYAWLFNNTGSNNFTMRSPQGSLEFQTFCRSRVSVSGLG